MKRYIHLYQTKAEFNAVYNGEEYLEPWLSYTEENSKVDFSKVPPEPGKEVTSITISDIECVVDVPVTGGTANINNISFSVIANQADGSTKDITSDAIIECTELVVPETTATTREVVGQLTVTASYDRFSNVATVDVYQEAVYIPVVTSITISNIECNVDAPAMGGTVYATDCTFEAYANYDDGSSEDVSSEATVEGELTVSKSKNTERHEAGTMTVTVTYSGVSETTSVTVYQEAFDYSMEPLTFNIISAGTINWKASNTAYTPTIYYSKDDGETWTDIASTTAGTSFNVDAGDEVIFKGDNTTYSSGASRYNTFSGSTAKFSVEGNIMSLVDSTGFTTATTLSNSNTFSNLFNSCTMLTSAENLILPVNRLTSSCYYNMFYNCTSLTTAPELPATTLANNCYQQMFQGCTSLNYIKCLATDISANSCTYNWLANVKSTGTFVKNANMTGWTTGINGIPNGWTVQDAS